METHLVPPSDIISLDDHVQLHHHQSNPQDHLFYSFPCPRHALSCDVHEKKGVIEALPEEVLLHIFAFLESREIQTSVERVCKMWYRLANDELLWKQKCIEDFKISRTDRSKNPLAPTFPMSEETAWKTVYKTNANSEKNWTKGKCHMREMDSRSSRANFVYFDDQLVSAGYDDGVLKFISRANRSSVLIPAHEQPITCFQYDSALMVSCSVDRKIKTWNFSHLPEALKCDLEKEDSSSTEEKMLPSSEKYCLQTLSGHEDQVNCVQFEGNKMISGSRDMTLCVWDREKGTQVERLKGHTGSVLWHQFIDNSLVSGSGDCSAKLWDLRTAKNVSTFAGHTGVIYYLQQSGNRLVTGGADRLVMEWDMRKPDVGRKLVGHEGPVIYLQFDDQKIVTGAIDKTIRIWSSKTGEEQHVLQDAGTVISLHYKENYLLSCSEGKLFEWNFLGKKAPRMMPKKKLADTTAPTITSTRKKSCSMQ